MSTVDGLFYRILRTSPYCTRIYVRMYEACPESKDTSRVG
jgi:hypothetical protein